MIIETLILLVVCFAMFYAIIIFHEYAHKAIFENYGVPAKIKINPFKAETIGDEEAIRQLSESEYQNVQNMHALVEIANFVLFSLFVMALLLILIIKFIS